MRRESILSALIIATLFAGPGCLMNISATSVQSGTAAEKAASAEIIVGETTRDAVIRQMGEPASTSTLDDGTEVLVYEGVLKESATFSMFLLINVQSKKTRTNTVTIKIRDGIVVDYQRDQTVEKE